MILSRSSLHKIGWAMILSVCFALLMALTFKVNTVKSQVRLTERQILAARQDKDLLETEFETRANQHQLAEINHVQFGYGAPTPTQYVEGERQLAALSKPRAANAPAPIMVAVADEAKAAGLASLVSPITGKAETAEAPRQASAKPAARTASLATRLAQAEPSGKLSASIARGAARE